MVQQFTEKMTVKDVVASPKDEILDAYIVKIEKGLLSEFLKPEVHSKFDNLEQDTLLIHFEYKYNDKVLGGTDRIAYYSEPMTHSKLGKFLEKYEKLEVGQKIKIEFNTEGFCSIRLK